MDGGRGCALDNVLRKALEISETGKDLFSGA